MARKAIHSNIKIEIDRIYPEEIREWKYDTFRLRLNKAQATQLSRELIEAVEKINDQEIEFTLFLKRKTPVITITWKEE